MFRASDLFSLGKDINLHNNKRADCALLCLTDKERAFKSMRGSMGSQKSLCNSQASLAQSPHSSLPPNPSKNENFLKFRQSLQGSKILAPPDMLKAGKIRGNASREGQRARGKHTHVDSIVGSISRLQELNNRNWSHVDINLEKTISGLAVPAGRNLVTATKSSLSQNPSQDNLLLSPSKSYSIKPPSTPSTYTRAQTPNSLLSTCSKRIPSLLEEFRTFSPEDNGYIQISTHTQNLAQKLTYEHIRESAKSSCGNIANERVTGGYPFECFQRGRKDLKSYNVSVTTDPVNRWKDRGMLKVVSNHESSKGHMLNHAYGEHMTVPRLLKNDKFACHKVKSIAEYSDLTRVTAPKVNPQYHAQLNHNPLIFRKRSGECSKFSDLARTYGPTVKSFKR